MEDDELKVLISFDLPSNYVNKIQKVSSSIEIVQSKDRQEALRYAEDSDVLLAGYFSEELFAAAKKLKWIQTWGAGVDRILTPEVVASNVVVTNASGVHPTPISEHVLGLMVCFSRKLHLFIRNQEKKRWETSESDAAYQIEELEGQTVGIVGFGRIGTEVARKAKCLGMRVIATKRDASQGASNAVDELFGPTDLAKLLAVSDFVVLSLPLTKETQGMISEPQFKSMKKTAYLINVSRGRIVQENVLIKALKEKWIAGAGLDTFEEEPLPKTSELWALKNVIITPHVAGQTSYYMERLTDIFCENLKRFIRKKPLMNLVDKTLGY